MTAAEKAEAASAEIETLHNRYRSAVRALGDSKDPDVAVRLPLIRAVWDAATSLNNSVERAIIQTDLLRLHSSEVWATDLSGTACNVLQSLPMLYSRMRKECALVKEPCPQASPMAFRSMQAVAAVYHPETAAGLKKQFTNAGLPTSGFDRPFNMSRFSSGERITAVITGIILLLVMLSIALFFREFNNFNLWVFRLVTALAAGIIGGTLIPGVFNVTHTTAKMVVRATGGCAFFFLVYFVNPPALVIQDTQTTIRSPDAKR